MTFVSLIQRKQEAVLVQRELELMLWYTVTYEYRQLSRSNS